LNPELLLAWLVSESAIKRIRAARGLKDNVHLELFDKIRKQYHKEEVPWVKEALSTVINRYEEQKKVSSKKKVVKKKSFEGNKIQAEEIEEIQSAAVSDSIGQVLHEIEPVVGALKVVARGEIENYQDSKLKEEFDRLDELLQTFEDWRRVEQSPRYSLTNVCELVSFQAGREKPDGIEFEINISKDLEFSTDQALLKIVFSNAIRNAVDSTLNVDLNDRRSIVMSAGRSEIGLWASVLDRGLGLPDKDKPILSSRYSTKPGHRGMGLAIID